MKYVRLTSPAYANGGRFVSAGGTLAVGDGAEEITEERATDIVVGERAIEVDEEGEAIPAKKAKAAA